MPAPCPATAMGLEPCGTGSVCAPFNGQPGMCVCAPFNGQPGMWCVDQDLYSSAQMYDECYQKPEGESCSIYRLRSDSSGAFALYGLSASKCIAHQCLQYRYVTCMDKKNGDACGYRDVTKGGVIMSYTGTCVDPTFNGAFRECVAKLQKQDGVAPKANRWPKSLDLRNATIANAPSTAKPANVTMTPDPPSPMTMLPSPPSSRPEGPSDVAPKTTAAPSSRSQKVAGNCLAAGIVSLLAGLSVLLM
ncbi:hypothetical protein P43SY_006230 [Pythium insidiosum]|uniref:Uncharacterized protein n=1 Tax=Pythium insidiosum TaxID=114742 RepID=A0AAD5Q6G0_PYTIN|nr:hypothetical protein P43SY_006230 [Pythium insidiosum]